MMNEKEMMDLVAEVKAAVERAATLKEAAKTEDEIRAGMGAAAEAINKANRAIEQVMGQLGC